MDNSKEFQLMLDKAIEIEPLAFKNFDRTKNIQDQLQKMVEGTHMEKLGRVYRAVVNMELHPSDSMEQLWLAFYMQEHSKYWTGEKWNEVLQV